MDILDRMSGTVSPAFFLQNIWLVMLTTQVPRAYCLTYLSRRLPRLDSNEGMYRFIKKISVVLILYIHT